MIGWNASRAARVAAREGVEAFIATTPPNVVYATGFWSPVSDLGAETCYALVPVEQSIPPR